MVDPAVTHAINHRLRRLLIEALWHSSDSLTAAGFKRDYFPDDDRVTLAMIAYHVRQLIQDKIVSLDEDGDSPIEDRPFVLDGPNSGEAVRLLGLTGRD